MVLRREIQKHESFLSLGLLLLRFPLLVCTSLDASKIGSLMLFIILMQESLKRRNVATLEHRDVGPLFDFLLTKRCDVATSRRCNVATCHGSSPLHLHISKKASKNRHFHLQCTQDPKIRYRVIMHLFKYRIVLKCSKDAGMT